MGANWNNQLTVNLLSAASAVERQSFGLICLATEGASFASGVHKIYESPSEVEADSELDAATKLAGTRFFAQEPHPQKLMIGEATYENVGGELSPTLDALKAAQDFYGLILGSRADDDIEVGDTWALANKKLFFGQTSSADMLSATTPNIGDTLKTAASGRSALIFRATDSEWLDIGLMAAFLSANPDVLVTTLAYQTCKGLGADDLTSSEKSNAEGYYCNLYLPFYGNSVVNKGWLSDGKRVDTILSKDWYSARCQENIAQLLVDKAALKSKVPFTDEGLRELANQILAVQKIGERIGHFRPGASTINIPKVVDIASADITARKATISATVILAGAVEEVTLNLAVLEA